MPFIKIKQYQGGLAECFPLVDKRSWLQSLYDKILLSDIVVRNKIRNERSLRMLVRKLAESVMQPTSIKRLQNILKGDGSKVTRDTISDFLDYMNAAFLTFSISNYNDNIVERATIQKRYFYDNGLLNLFIIDPDTKLLENQVAIALYNRYGERLLYFNKQIEVDFLVYEEKMLVQVSYSIQDETTRNREVDALLKAAKFLKAENLSIITFNEEETIDRDGYRIGVLPIYKFLLQAL